MAEILKIKIKVGDVDVEITPEEARELSEKLDMLLGRPLPMVQPYVPYVLPICPQPLPIPWTWPIITCGAGETTGLVKN